MPLISSISGLRGTIPDSLTADVISNFTQAFARFADKGTIIIGRDGRPSGKEISETICATLALAGRNVIEIGVVPTPTVQMEIERHHAAGGIAISASHNPAEWNGLKFLASTGMFLLPEESKRFNEIAGSLTSVNPSSTLSANSGTVTHVTDAIEHHITKVLSIPFLDKEKIKAKKFRVVVDAVNAAGSVAVPSLLEQLGCEVIRLSCDGSGVFPHTPEPLPENLTSLCNAVKQYHADLGVAVDPDADRLVLITEQGEPFGEEYTIVQCVKTVLQSAKKTGVVINLSTTRAVEDVAAQFGVAVVRTPVGEINVALKMKEIGAAIGGEGSGGVILGSVHYGRDSLVGCALTLHHLATFGGTASALRASLPQYYMAKRKITLDSLAQADTLLKNFAAEYANYSLRKDDGIRAELPAGDWIHVRKSNTEPIVRVIAESRTREQAEKLAASVTL